MSKASDTPDQAREAAPHRILDLAQSWPDETTRTLGHRLVRPRGVSVRIVTGHRQGGAQLSARPLMSGTYCTGYCLGWQRVHLPMRAHILTGPAVAASVGTTAPTDRLVGLRLPWTQKIYVTELRLSSEQGRVTFTSLGKVCPTRESPKPGSVSSVVLVWQRAHRCLSSRRLAKDQGAYRPC